MPTYDQGAETIFQDRVMLVEINRYAEGRSVYDAARYAWKASLPRAKKLDYVLALRKGIIVGVFASPHHKTKNTAAQPPRRRRP